MSIIVAGTIRIPVENIPVALPALKAALAATRAEDGCETYSFAHDVADPGLLRIFEMWRDRAALDAHIEAANSAAWREAASGWGLSESSVFAYEAGDPRPL